VDEVGVLRAEEGDGPRRIRRLSGTPERNGHPRHLTHLFRDAERDLLGALAGCLHRLALLLCLGQAGLDEAEGDGIAVDLELAPFLGDGLGETRDAGLGG
jgi:hypothetical protein